jgi:hypothetical protein
VQEAVARRNLYRRSSGRADVDYLRELPDSLRLGVKVGQQVASDKAYIETLATSIETLASMLSLKWAARVRRFRNSDYPQLIDRIVGLENARQWSSAARIAETALTYFDFEEDPEGGQILRVNLWFCKQEMGTDDRATTLAIEEWDATGDNFLGLAKALLMRDHKKAARLLAEQLKGSDQLRSRRHLRNAPLVQRSMAESSQVRAMLTDGGRKKASGRRGQYRRTVPRQTQSGRGPST